MTKAMIKLKVRIHNQLHEKNQLTLHLDFAKFFFSCSDTVPWIFLLLAAFPEILQ